MFTAVPAKVRTGHANARPVQRFIPNEVTTVESECNGFTCFERVKFNRGAIIENNRLIAESEAAALNPIEQDDLGVQDAVQSVVSEAMKQGPDNQVIVDPAFFQSNQTVRFFVFALRAKIERCDLPLKIFGKGKLVIVEHK